MGFSGGGSNVLKPHKHSSAAQDGSPLNMNNVTEATLNANDIVYSDGSALQPLAIGADAEVLGVSGGAPTWITNTSNPLVKVSKTFSDIAANEIDIYTLPQDAALVNVYTDITTVFDLSAGVTVGDSGDDNGFLEASDWTAGTGLTDATRGVYITSFKTMRSTSGTTTIKAYNFGGGVQSCYGQGIVADGNTTPGSAIANTYATGAAPVGFAIEGCTFNCKTTDAAHSNLLYATIYDSAGVLQDTSTNGINNNTLNAGSYTEMVFTFAGTHTLADGDRIALFNTNGSGNLRQAQESGFVGANPAMTEYQAGSWNAPNTAYQIEQCVTATQADTQGEVDFYLQVVD